jgi:hypothetical protein
VRAGRQKLLLGGHGSGFLKKPALLVWPRQNLRVCGEKVGWVGSSHAEFAGPGRFALGNRVGRAWVAGGWVHGDGAVGSRGA